LPSNRIQGASVQQATITPGYWNSTNTPSGLESISITPTSNDLPALQVAIVKDNSNSNQNGPVPAYLAGIFGIKSLKTSATATAVISSPGYVGPGGLFPIAITKCLYDTYWDSNSNSPKTAPNSGVVTGFPYPYQVQGQPYFFDIGSSYHYGSCDSGQWTTFNSSDNSAKTAKDMLASGNITGFDIGQNQTWIQTGTEDTLFKGTAACADQPVGNGTCAWVTVPVVDSVASNGSQTVVAIASLHILDAQNGSMPYVLVQMSNDPSKCETPNSGGIGPGYGATTPPRLVQ
jgi:hypothetical protein